MTTTRLPMTEKDWQGLVVAAATVHGWWVFHPHDSRRSTPGWPDLALLRPPEFILVELKSDRGRVTPEQRQVLGMLDACGVEAFVWRPVDEPDVMARLRRKRSPSTSGLDGRVQAH